jgi:3-oxoadipate enol-lactonase
VGQTLVRTADTGRGRVSYAERGSGSPVVILHSLLTHRASFDPIADRIPGRVVTVDLPGFGETSAAGGDIDDFAHRMAAAIDVMSASEPVTLLGNGLGAFVALGVAIHHRSRVRRLVVVGCGARFTDDLATAFDRLVDTAERGGMEAVVPTALARVFGESYLAAHPAAGYGVARSLVRTDPTVFVTACEALQSVDYSALARNITQPTLIVVGEEDRATPPALATTLHGLVQGSTLVTLPGVAHAPHLQDPDGLLAAIIPFIAGGAVEERLPAEPGPSSRQVRR